MSGRFNNLIQRSCLFAALIVAVVSTPAMALDLQGTSWETVAHSFHLDPYLLYSIALVESSVYRGRGATSPWPWVINTPAGPRYTNSRYEAKRELSTALSRYPARRIDVGLMQISAGWQGHRVAQISDLLDPEVNLRTAAGVLIEALLSAPHDLVLAIGHYHSQDPVRARRYGRRVLTIYSRITSTPNRTGRGVSHPHSSDDGTNFVTYRR